MTRKQIIQKLEGRTITTADGIDHIVKNGKFTAHGEIVPLASLPIYHLKEFLNHAD